MLRDHGAKYTLVADDEASTETMGTHRRLGKRMAVLVAVVLCGVSAAVVLLTAMGETSRTLHLARSRRGVKETDANDHSVRFSELYMMRCNYTAVYFNYDEKTDKFKPIAKMPRSGECSWTAGVPGSWLHAHSYHADLKPDTYYYYQYGHEEHALSHVRRFKSRPSKSTKYANFIAYADMGAYVEPGSASTAGRVYEDVMGGGYDSFLLHFGDISYARSVGCIWDQFFHLIEPYATRLGGKHDLSGGMLPYGGSFNPSWGNFGIDSAGECGVPMHHRWHAPKTGNWIYWYSFNYGGVHVIQMSTEHNWTRGSEQYEWLQHDLEQVDRSVTPWVVLTAHRMMYTTQMNIESDMKVSYKFQEEVEDLIYKHRVNLMMVGHEHAYERSCPLYRKECVADGKGTVHIVVGSAGYPLGTEDFSDKYGKWSLRHVNDYGYLRIASSPEDMRIQFVLNKNGNVYDEFAIAPWED
ncbi:Metallo-dependent phosphatase-like [Phytophthora cactorum]|nr:Metallo-dependent phosphatase-like [Phytophthora cactorum]